MELFHARRMLQHADFMEQIPNEQIQLGSWYYNLHVVPEADDYTNTEATHNCGTVACVLGWAGINPAFKELGLKTYEDGSVMREIPFVRFTPQTVADIAHCEKVKPDSYSSGETEAGGKFFGLTGEEADELFGGSPTPYVGYVDWESDDFGKGPTNKEVAHKLRSFVYERFPELETK